MFGTRVITTTHSIYHFPENGDYTKFSKWIFNNSDKILTLSKQSKEEIIKTIEIARKLNPDFAHFTITTPYPATDLYQLGLDQKILPYDYWRNFAMHPSKDFTPMLWEEKLKKEELIYLLKKAYRSFYLRPSYIVKRLLAITSWSELWTKAKMGLKILKV